MRNFKPLAVFIELGSISDTFLKTFLTHSLNLVVWCGMSFWPFMLPKFILLFLWFPYGSNEPKILGCNFSRPSTLFYGTFKIYAIEITYLAITWVLACLDSRF